MKNPTLVVVLLLLVSIASAQRNNPRQVNPDVAAIEEVILEAYVNGFLNDGIPRNIELGYSPEFKSVGMMEDGRTLVQTYEGLMARVKQSGANGQYPLQDQNRISVNYLKMEVVGAAATVKLELRQNNELLYTDMLGLYKFPTGWLIVNRIYDQRKEPQKL